MTLTPAPSAPGPGEILRRILVPLAIFAGVLLSLLLLSWFALLPRFTRVDLHGTLQGAEELRAYVRQMEDDIRHQEDRRLELILPLDSSPFGELVQEKTASPHLLDFAERVRNVARTFLPGQAQAVLLTSFAQERQTVELAGDVRNVGFQSMAVLAKFVEALRSMPGVARVDFPPFTRQRDADIGYHSPFTIRIHLQH